MLNNKNILLKSLMRIGEDIGVAKIYPKYLDNENIHFL